LSVLVLCINVIEMNTAMKSFQILLLATAGAASFYLATHWSRFASDETASIVEPVTREARPKALSVDAGTQAEPVQERDSTLSLPQRDRVVPDSTGKAFANLSWIPPAPPQRVAPPPPPPPPVVPVAPPLPFTFVGLLEQGSARPQAFISKGDVLFVVSAGDMLEGGTYRVDTLSAQQITMTYLPLNTPQTLNILGTTK
jgi:hypothetical protein